MGVTPAATVHTVAAFLISWIVIIAVLTAASLRLPSAFTLIFVLVELALILVLAGTVNGTPDLSKAAGIVVFAFAAVGAYSRRVAQRSHRRTALPAGPSGNDLTRLRKRQAHRGTPGRLRAPG